MLMVRHVLMRDEKEGRRKQARSNKQQHSTPKAVTFLKKNELPRVGLKPTTRTCTSRATLVGQLVEHWPINLVVTGPGPVQGSCVVITVGFGCIILSFSCHCHVADCRCC